MIIHRHQVIYRVILILVVALTVIVVVQHHQVVRHPAQAQVLTQTHRIKKKMKQSNKIISRKIKIVKI